MKTELAKDRNAWDTYINSKPTESFYHHWVWREVIEETFGHQAYYLTAVEDGAIRGVLPLISIRSRLFGDSLVSIPFFSYGGVLADTEQARESLLAGAAELGRELGARHIELRQGDPTPTSWPMSSPKVTMEIHLPDSVDEYFNQLSSGTRNKIRYGLKSGLRVEWEGPEAIPLFYKIFATNMRNLGTPVYPIAFFKNQMRRLDNKIRILTLWDGAKPVAAGVVTAHRDTLELPWSASLSDSRKKQAPMMMYWALVGKAIESGLRTVDLGRCSRGSGTYEFKRHWNPVERPLHWYYWLAGGSSLPELRPDNPKFRFATNLWKRLPLVVANGLGPRLVRSLP